jgi:hypothetical protein
MRPTLTHPLTTVGGNQPPPILAGNRTLGGRDLTPPAGPVNRAVAPQKMASQRHSPQSHLRMLMARAMTSAVVDKAMELCTVMSSFAHRVNGIVSVGEKAVALVMLT